MSFLLSFIMRGLRGRLIRGLGEGSGGLGVGWRCGSVGSEISWRKRGGKIERTKGVYACLEHCKRTADHIEG